MTAPLLPVAAVIHVAGAGDYVLDLVATRDGSFLAAGTSGGAVVGLDPAAAGGAATLLVGRHAAAVTACVLDQASIITSSLDGTVGVWDARAGGRAGPAQSFTAAQPLHCVARVGHHLVAGADGRICLWDGRTGRRVGSFDDTHDGDVTCLVAPTDDDPAGAPSAPGVASPLLSAGVDGLVAVWDLGRGVLEDDAFVTALNAGTSISRLGTHPPGRLWASTHCEGLTLWDWGAACDEADPRGGVGPLGKVEDACTCALAAAQAAGGGPAWPAGGGPADSGATPGAVIGCANVGVGDGGGGTPPRLALALAPPGACLGTLALFPLADPPGRGGPPLLGPPEAILTGGHTDTVRAWAWLGGGGGGGGGAGGGPLAAATGGEDGCVVLWGTPGAAAGGGAQALPMGRTAGGAVAAGGGGGPTPNKGGLKKGSVRRRSTPSG